MELITNLVPNVAIVDHRISKAKSKLASFELRVRKIDRYIDELQSERDSTAVILEYVDLSERRQRLLLDLFAYPDEYGHKEHFPDLLVGQLRAYHASLERSISFYQAQKAKRIEGTEFLRQDIGRLEKIRAVRLQPQRFLFAVPDFNGAA